MPYPPFMSIFTYFSASNCPMGGSSSSRLFGTLAQSLKSIPLAEQDLYPEGSSDNDLDLVELDPDKLLRECEEALHRRPARPRRDLVYPNIMVPQRHKHNPSIRIMQWNILAQGRDQTIPVRNTDKYADMDRIVGTFLINEKKT